MSSFADFPLLPSLQATLADQGLTVPTEIQARAIPELLEGRSIVGIAETGSGKTLSYALPVLHRLKTLEEEGSPVEDAGRPRAAILVPTRELGEQVSRVLKTFTHTTRLRVRAVLGGATMEVARRNVAGPFEILVATPGRLLQLMDLSIVGLEDVRTLVVDEVDQLLDLGFLTDVSRVVRAAPDDRQIAMFSATVAPEVEAQIVGLFHKPPFVVRTKGSHRVVPTLTTVNRKVVDGKRFDLLEQVLREPCEGGTLIFANTREQCDKIERLLDEAGQACVVYRGEMDKAERRANLEAFRSGQVGLLIATDLGSRGLDLEAVARVINYHLPHQLENYLHRVGRTARAGRAGLVINFVTERDEKLMAQLGRVAARRS
ncbi:MAG: DEAD/DEAH box helicase [Myxococcota bacterium]